MKQSQLLMSQISQTKVPEKFYKNFKNCKIFMTISRNELKSIWNKIQKNFEILKISVQILFIQIITIFKKLFKMFKNHKNFDKFWSNLKKQLITENFLRFWKKSGQGTVPIQILKFSKFHKNHDGVHVEIFKNQTFQKWLKN